MKWSGAIIGYAMTWAAMELARPVFMLTQLYHFHELLFAGALILWPFALSFAAEEWVGEGLH